MSDEEYGAISRNEEVKSWVLATPKCPKCGFFIACHFGGLRHEYVYPHCSNTQCSLHHIETFILNEPKK